MSLANPIGRITSSEKSPTPWGARIVEALGGKSQAWLAREAGIGTRTISDIIAKTMPSALYAVLIARALDVPVEWLITGEVSTGTRGLIAADAADWVVVPHYRLAEFSESAKPEPIEQVPLRKDWLNRNARTATKLWLTELPTAVEGLGEEGDTILCRDADHHAQEGVYLYFLDGIPLVRSFKLAAAGQLADAQQGWAWQPDEPTGMRLVARVLGTIKLRPV